MIKFLVLVAISVWSASGTEIDRLAPGSAVVFPVIVNYNSVNASCPMYHRGYQFSPSTNTFKEVLIVNSPKQINRDRILSYNFDLKEAVNLAEATEVKMAAELAGHEVPDELPDRNPVPVESPKSSARVWKSRSQNTVQSKRSTAVRKPSRKTFVHHSFITDLLNDESKIVEVEKCILKLPCRIRQPYRALITSK